VDAKEVHYAAPRKKVLKKLSAKIFFNVTLKAERKIPRGELIVIEFSPIKKEKDGVTDTTTRGKAIQRGACRPREYGRNNLGGKE